MDNNKKGLTTGFTSEYLGVTPAKVGDKAVGVVSVRPDPTQNFQSVNFMFNRPALERMVEDLTYILKHSKVLAEGEHMDQELTVSNLEKPPK